MLSSRLKSRPKKPPKRVLALPDLEQATAAVLNSLTSASGQRTYDHAITEFVAWYCSEPRLAFNRTIPKSENTRSPCAMPSSTVRNIGTSSGDQWSVNLRREQLS
jgi:hypothetical protein